MTQRPSLTDDQHALLRQAMQDQDLATRIRAQAVLRWFSGWSAADVGSRANVSSTTIRRWTQQFSEFGLPGLEGTLPAHTMSLRFRHHPHAAAMVEASRLFLASVGDDLRQSRDARGWTRAELSERCGVNYTQARIGMWERGDRAPALAAFPIICRALQLPPATVLAHAYASSFGRMKELPQ